MNFVSEFERGAIIDCETTGRENCEPIEVAMQCVEFTPDGVKVASNVVTQRFKPSGKMEAGAVAVHGILPSDLAGEPPSCDAPGFVQDKLAEWGATHLIGHHIDFDAGIVHAKQRRICTLAFARKCWPELDSHKLGALMYELFGFTDEIRDIVTGAHSAHNDVRMTFDLFEQILLRIAARSVDAVWFACERARIPSHMPFGKHAGEPIASIPLGYITWATKNLTDADPYLMHALRSRLPTQSA